MSVELVDEITRALEAGDVVVLPTDTVYGLVALARDASATARLAELKGRPTEMPIALLCASTEQALDLAATDVVPAVRAAAERWWPGPLTLVLPQRSDPAASVGVRVPDDDLVRAVAARVGPLAATSANRHGEPTPTTAAEVARAFGEEVALVVDGGPSTHGASTVIDATGWPWRALREGPIATSDILDIAAAAQPHRAHGGDTVLLDRGEEGEVR